MSGFIPPGDCPNCGEAVPAGAKSCPHCGSDERSGWNDDTYLDGVDLPGEGFDDHQSSDREFGSGQPRGARGWLALAIAVGLILVLSGVWWLR